MAKTRRARIDAENGHRRVTRPRLRITAKETRGIPTSYLRASSDTIQHGPESCEVGYDEAKPLCGLCIRFPCILIRKQQTKPINFLNRAFLVVAAASRCWVRGFWGSAGGARSAPHARFEVGASNPKPAGALVLVKPTQVALAAAHQTRLRRSVGKCARSAPWILTSAVARFRKRVVLSHDTLAGAVASFCAACQDVSFVSVCCVCWSPPAQARQAQAGPQRAIAASQGKAQPGTIKKHEWPTRMAK